jgi:hypothetical protein
VLRAGSVVWASRRSWPCAGGSLGASGPLPLELEEAVCKPRWPAHPTSFSYLWVPCMQYSARPTGALLVRCSTVTNKVFKKVYLTAPQHTDSWLGNARVLHALYQTTRVAVVWRHAQLLYESPYVSYVSDLPALSRPQNRSLPGCCHLPEIREITPTGLA